MSNISFKVDPAQLEGITKRLDGIAYKSPTVLKNAANTTGKKALAELKEYISTKYAYQGKDSFTSHIKRKSATYANPRMIIDVKSNMNELIDFDVSHRYALAWTDPSSWVSGRVRNDSALTPITKGGFKAFIAEFASGHASVVTRVGQGRKIRTVSSPSFTHMATRGWEENESEINNLLHKSIDIEIEKIMERING